MNKKHFGKKKGPKLGFFLQSIEKFLLKNHNQSYNYKQIAKALELSTKFQLENVIKALHQLVQEGKIKEEDKGKYQICVKFSELQGVLDVTKSGNGFVMVDGLEGDIYISEKDMGGAFHGDTVSVLVAQSPKKEGKTKGKITGIIQRAKEVFVGNLSYDSARNFGFVIIDNNQFHSDIYIKKEDFKGAKDGEKVVVKIVKWSTTKSSPTGEIIQVLGDPKDHQVKMHAILAEYNLPIEFDPEVERAAKELDTRILPEEIAKRKDMRGVLTFTIDPEDAKDFDDALSFEILENGNYSIGVHIADVAHYLQPGTLLDQEAQARATSIYLVDRVVPMLPEVLSNFACSLRPNEDKYTFSAVFEFSPTGVLKDQWFGRTVIHSNKRFTYQQAQDIIETKEGDFATEILILDKIAKKMRAKRIQEGALTFDRVEVKFNVSPQGDPLGIFFKQSKDANHLIEEYMLLANKKVSEFVSLKSKKASGYNFLYRIHDEPNPEKLQNLKRFVSQFGYEIQLQGKKKIAQSLNQLLLDVKGKPEESMIETLTLRSMSKAEYSTQNIGHYGLGFEYYSHFTSPIRRYPDVLAHRILQQFLEGDKPYNLEELEGLCKHCSSREKLASEAERESIKYMQVKYMEQFVGETFDGVITGVTEWGIYVEITENRSEGLIRLKSLMDDHYIFDAQNYCIKGQGSGKIITLGDKVKIKVKSADIEKKQLDFELVEN
ncbi:MAG: ribonuclease R [Flavobacteriaceae bacterium]|nr:MAG: ribonuclease R [Flavobacteriaceae bacterium]